MGNLRFSSLSPMECRVLSELVPIGRDGVSCTELARSAGLSRASLYVFMRRLDEQKFVRRPRVQVAGRPEMQVLYAITARGLQARARFARDLGLTP